MIKTRFAPSPTGYLHIGALRTALYNFLFASKNKGKFFLRIEDTDQNRFVKGATENIFQTLKEFKLDYDEKVFKQSERLQIYQKYAYKLIGKKKAYYCFCSQNRLNKLREKQKEKKLAPKYDKHCLKLTSEKIKKKLAEKTPFVIRFNVEAEKNVKFDDLIRGNIDFKTKNIDDQVLIKSDGFPTYHLASIVDDNETQITHVIRGEEWLSSTPKHILLYEALGFEKPKFAHLPLLLNPDKSKLSKRTGDVAVTDYLKKGYLPEALLNFVFFLGWNPGDDREIFNLKEMIKAFRLEKVHKAGAVFNIEKLNWINGEYIKKMPMDDFFQKALLFWPESQKNKLNKEKLLKIAALEKERIKNFADIGRGIEFFFNFPKYEKELLRWKKMTNSEIYVMLNLALELINSILEKDFFKDKIEEVFFAKIQEQKIGVGEILWPLRVALTGEKKSPPPFDIAEILGKEETIKRIKMAIKYSA